MDPSSPEVGGSLNLGPAPLWSRHFIAWHGGKNELTTKPCVELIYCSHKLGRDTPALHWCFYQGKCLTVLVLRQRGHLALSHPASSDCLRITQRASEGHLSGANKKSEKTEVSSGLEQHKKMQCLLWCLKIVEFSVSVGSPQSEVSVCLYDIDCRQQFCSQGQSFRETWGGKSLNYLK